jgi:hypothetical protein
MTTKAEKASTKSKAATKRPTIQGKTRKAIVCEAWRKNPEASIEDLAKVSKGIKPTTIRSWRAAWRQGWGFPVGYGPTTRPESKGKAAKSKKSTKGAK